MNELTLKQEVILLRPAVAGLVGVDKEGNYRPEFLMETLGNLYKKPSNNISSSADSLKNISKG